MTSMAFEMQFGGGGVVSARVGFVRPGLSRNYSLNDEFGNQPLCWLLCETLFEITTGGLSIWGC